MTKDLENIYKKGKKQWRKIQEATVTDFKLTLFKNKIKKEIWQNSNKNKTKAIEDMETEMKGVQTTLEADLQKDEVMK